MNLDALKVTRDSAVNLLGWPEDREGWYIFGIHDRDRPRKVYGWLKTRRCLKGSCLSLFIHVTCLSHFWICLAHTHGFNDGPWSGEWFPSPFEAGLCRDLEEQLLGHPASSRWNSTVGVITRQKGWIKKCWESRVSILNSSKIRDPLNPLLILSLLLF